ncbi:Erythromycin esterase [Nonomuraea coxensis DSM 45129]|uniref:Erythromycin esterase n=1 Tax=Nonomuraea coxensis DSM 45129 TaxID=1122611 RepID=A0ABX8TWZ9_9ACTN|nr:erythromycin esterase family protein [Nonomuraea coxensis]QYC40020.1 Erythromycin esterase [Nonomuraea coxensis DSM 45129]
MHDEITRWLAGRAVPLDGLAPFRAALDGVRLAGLGEATHGSAEFFSLRRRLTEFLVRELGFTTVAIEASAAAARAVDEHVRTGRGDARQAVAGLGFWTLDTAEMLAVVEWLREHNRTAERPVGFAGVDPQHPGAALRTLRELLDGAAGDLLDPLEVLARSRWGRDEPLGPEVEAAARRLTEHVAEHMAGGTAGHTAEHTAADMAGRGPGEVLKAVREAARVVGQAAELSCRPFTHADPALTLGAARDRHMAENASLLLAEPGAKVVLWAHNGHVGKGRIGGAPTMGRHLADAHGAAYYALGALFGSGAFRAIPRSRLRRRPRFLRFGSPPPEDRPTTRTFRVPPAGTPLAVETRLAAACPADHVVDLRGGERPAAVAEWLAGTAHLRAFGAVAGRLTAKFAFMPVVPGEEFDGLAFVHTATASTPLAQLTGRRRPGGCRGRRRARPSP